MSPSGPAPSSKIARPGWWAAVEKRQEGTSPAQFPLRGRIRPSMQRRTGWLQGFAERSTAIQGAANAHLLGSATRNGTWRCAFVLLKELYAHQAPRLGPSSIGEHQALLKSPFLIARYFCRAFAGQNAKNLCSHSSCIFWPLACGLCGCRLDAVAVPSVVREAVEWTIAMESIDRRAEAM